MADTTYGDISPRTAAWAAKELLKRAVPYLIFEKFAQGQSLPSKSSKTVIFRRYNALNPAPQALVEGVTPASTTLTKTDITCTLVQYGSVIGITDIILDTHEDNVLGESIDLLGEQAAQMIEIVRFGVLKAGTNVCYSNGASRVAVNTPITLAAQRKVTKALKRQNARPITKVISSTPDFGTENVAASYIAVHHPDVDTDIKNMVGVDGRIVFIPVEKYGSTTPYPNEIGKVDDVRYLNSTLCTPWIDAGGAKGTMLSTGGTSADVYPIIFIAQDSYAIVALKGKHAITPMVVNPRPAPGDALGQRGTIGFKTLTGCVILNDQWLCRLEVAVTA